MATIGIGAIGACGLGRVMMAVGASVRMRKAALKASKACKAKMRWGRWRRGVGDTTLSTNARQKAMQGMQIWIMSGRTSGEGMTVLERSSGDI